VRARSHERRVPHHARLRRPAPRRLRPGSPREARARAPPARDRLRRQGGVPRPLRRAAGARPAAPRARPNGALRAAVHLARERGRAVRGEVALVPRAARVARPYGGRVTAVLVVIHLLAAAVWVGGSTALIFVGVPAVRILE